MKKVILICMLLISVGILSGCTEEDTVEITFQELIESYSEKYPDSKLLMDISSDLEDITIYHNCTIDEWLEWNDNLTIRGRLEYYNLAKDWTEIYRTTDVEIVFVFHRYIDESFESYESPEEKYLVEITNQINWAYSYKNEVIAIINSNDIDDFEDASRIVQEIFWTSVKIARHDNDSIQANKSMNIFFDFLDNITKLQSLIWQKNTFRSYLRENLTNETKNITAITAFLVDYLFDQISDMEDGKIYAYSEIYGSQIFNFTNDGIIDAVTFQWHYEYGSISLPAGTVRITSTIHFPGNCFITGSGIGETILYVEDDLDNDSAVFEFVNASNVSISNIRLMYMNPTIRPLFVRVIGGNNGRISDIVIGSFPFPLVFDKDN